jgi:soluble lytic murein transglycosylase-like protein
MKSSATISRMVRGLAVLLALSAMTVADAALAQVHLLRRADGTKVIANDDALPSSARLRDLSWLARQHDRETSYDEIIERYAARFHVDRTLIKAVIQVESNYEPLCVSNRGARGLMQLMPETARRFAVRKIFDPEENIRGGVQYLSVLLDLFSYDLPSVLAAYNAGETTVRKYGGIPPYAETSDYVRRALTVYYGSPYGVVTSGGLFSGGGRKLKGGFKAAVGQLAIASIPSDPVVLKPSEIRVIGAN